MELREIRMVDFILGVASVDFCPTRFSGWGPDRKEADKEAKRIGRKSWRSWWVQCVDCGTLSCLKLELAQSVVIAACARLALL